MIIRNFGEDVLGDYETQLDHFFDAKTGAVVEHRRNDGTPRFLFTEVTGYAILDFLLLYSITGKEEYLFKAGKCGDWIINSARDACGGVKTRYYFEEDGNPDLLATSFYGRRIFSFDTAICLKALVALYDKTHDAVYREAAEKMGEFLISMMVQEDGSVCAVYNAANDEYVQDDPARWSKQSGSFHAKVGEALIDLYSVIKKDEYRNKAEMICENALRFQSDDGNFKTSEGLTELHPHCYSAEGLLHVGRRIQNHEFIKAARAATEWAVNRSKKGEIPQVFDYTTGEPMGSFRTDGLAQALGLAADLLHIGQFNRRYKNKLNGLASRIMNMKSSREKYFKYGFYEKEYNGSLESDTRSYWTNMFCLRGLYKYYRSYLLDQTYVVILAGGKGTRCWPISCETKPKPFAESLLGDRSLLEETVRRYTANGFFNPKRIFFLCSQKAKNIAVEHAKTMKIPKDNIIFEKQARDTLPAVSLALKQMDPLDKDEDRLVVVSMADNVFEPYADFQRAVIQALSVARENECFVSVGKPVSRDDAFDGRFGHIRYTRRINGYRCFRVDEFHEKPGEEKYEELRQKKDHLAWDCGTVVFKHSCFNRTVPSPRAGQNLSKNLLAKAADWSSTAKNRVRVAISCFSWSFSFLS